MERCLDGSERRYDGENRLISQEGELKYSVNLDCAGSTAEGRTESFKKVLTSATDIMTDNLLLRERSREEYGSNIELVAVFAGHHLPRQVGMFSTGDTGQQFRW